MQARNIIVIGASAGSLGALKTFVNGLQKSFTGSVFITMHVPPHGHTRLAEILSAAGPLQATLAVDGERMERGRIYIAPNNCHLLLSKDETMLVQKGPHENRFRPSIDVLFRSAAYEHGPRVIGIILSGALQDGVSGLYIVQRLGGTAIIQDPAEAEVPFMPTGAMRNITGDYILSATDMAPVVSGLVTEMAPERPQLPEAEKERLKMEVEIAAQHQIQPSIMSTGKPSILNCPECNGSLVEIQEGGSFRYRCYTGHAYSPAALISEMTDVIERNIGQAIRGLEEISFLYDTIRDKELSTGIQADGAAAHEGKSQEAKQKADQLNEFLHSLKV